MRESPRPFLDVRSPGEFAKGRIPGAISLPLFTDEERHRVGLCYATEGPDEALDLGLQIVGPKMAYFVQLVRKVAIDGQLTVYCWRGGMRSQSVAQLLQMAGIRAHRIEGGYKRFRRWALERLERSPELRVLGGYTGSGKTEVLARLGDRVIDLEKIAGHRGSAFGHLGAAPQPTQEQFENSLAWELERLGPGPIWVEDESRNIGRCRLPNAFYDAMQKAPLYLLESPLEERKQRLLELYGKAPKEALSEAVGRLERRLGSQRARDVQERIQRGDNSAIEPLLDYYDRCYQHALKRREGEILHYEATRAHC